MVKKTYHVNNQVIKWNSNIDKWVVLKPDGTMATFRLLKDAQNHAHGITKYLKRR